MREIADALKVLTDSGTKKKRYNHLARQYSLSNPYERCKP